MLGTVLCLGLVAEREIELSPLDNLSVFHILIFQGLCNCKDLVYCLFFFSLILRISDIEYFWYLIRTYLNLVKGDEMAFLAELS